LPNSLTFGFKRPQVFLFVRRAASVAAWFIMPIARFSLVWIFCIDIADFVRYHSSDDYVWGFNL